MKLTVFNEPRKAPGTLKNKLAALAVGDSFECPDPHERNKLYSIARRLEIRLQGTGPMMKRIR